MSKKIVTRTPGEARTEGLRCITRITINMPKRTRGWQVRVIRSGQNLSKFFADAKFGGRAGSLSEAMHFRDDAVKKLPLRPHANPVGQVTKRNTSGIPGVRKGTQTVRRGLRVHTYVVWTASGSPAFGKRKVRHFYVGKNLTEEAAREAAIAQRLRWEKQMLRRQERQAITPL